MKLGFVKSLKTNIIIYWIVVFILKFIIKISEDTITVINTIFTIYVVSHAILILFALAAGDIIFRVNPFTSSHDYYDYQSASEKEGTTTVRIAISKIFFLIIHFVLLFTYSKCN